MASIIQFPVWRAQALKAPAGFVPSAANLLRLIAVNQQPKEGVLVEYRKRPHWLDETLAREARERAERQLSRATRKTLMTYALKTLFQHSERQFAVLDATVIEGHTNAECARHVGVTPAAIGSYKRRGLINLHKAYHQAERTLRG